MLIAFVVFLGLVTQTLVFHVKLAVASEQTNYFSAFSASEGWDAQGMQFIHWHDVGLTNGSEAAI